MDLFILVIFLAKFLHNVTNCISEAPEFSIFVGCFQPPFLPPTQENIALGYAPAFALNLEISSEMSLNIKVCCSVITFRILW